MDFVKSALLAFLQLTRCTSTITTIPNTMTVVKDQSESIHIANAPIESIMSDELVEKWQDAHDACQLRFALPDGRELLGEDPTLPTCISVQYNGVDESSGEPAALKKSYLPISHPNPKETFDLLVKGHPLRPGGGVGAYLCGLQVGDSIQATFKPKRNMAFGYIPTSCGDGNGRRHGHCTSFSTCKNSLEQ
jgi:hypothetical protein